MFKQTARFPMSFFTTARTRSEWETCDDLTGQFDRDTNSINRSTARIDTDDKREMKMNEFTSDVILSVAVFNVCCVLENVADQIKQWPPRHKGSMPTVEAVSVIFHDVLNQ